MILVQESLSLFWNCRMPNNTHFEGLYLSLYIYKCGYHIQYLNLIVPSSNELILAMKGNAKATQAINTASLKTRLFINGQVWQYCIQAYTQHC